MLKGMATSKVLLRYESVWYHDHVRHRESFWAFIGPRIDFANIKEFYLSYSSFINHCPRAGKFRGVCMYVYWIYGLTRGCVNSIGKTDTLELPQSYAKPSIGYCRCHQWMTVILKEFPSKIFKQGDMENIWGSILKNLEIVAQLSKKKELLYIHIFDESCAYDVKLFVRNHQLEITVLLQVNILPAGYHSWPRPWSSPRPCYFPGSLPLPAEDWNIHCIWGHVHWPVHLLRKEG